MSIVGFSPSMQIIDPRTGTLTRDGSLLVQFFVDSVNGAGAVLTNDGIQALTNKTISGNSNTLKDIDTDSLKSRSGDGETIVTAAEAGTTGRLAVWQDGNLGEGIEVVYLPSTEDVVLRTGDNPMSGPLVLAQYAVADVPDATAYAGGMIYVTNETGGAVPAFSDGTNWRRVQDRNVIS